MHSPGQDDRSSPDSAEGLSIGAVSQLTGIPTPTIRSWERRYGLPVAHRDGSGYRRYTPADVQTLTRLRAEIATGGRNTAAVAALLREAAATPPDHVVDLLVAAAHRLDPHTVRRELEQAQHRHGLEVTVDEVVLPALREIGVQWAARNAIVAHEHLLTGAVLSWLAAVQQQAPSPKRPAPVLLACGPDEQHTVALQAFATLLAHQGVDCRVLGGQTPTASIAPAVTTSQAQAAVLVCHRDQHRPATLAALHTLAALPCRVYYAGGAFAQPRSRDGVPGTYLGESLTSAARQLTDDAEQDRQINQQPRP